MKHHPIVTLFAVLANSAALAQVAAAAPSGPEIVAQHAITLNAPVGGPTQYMPSGPLLGNGDIGVMQSGPAEQLIYYLSLIHI